MNLPRPLLSLILCLAAASAPAADPRPIFSTDLVRGGPVPVKAEIRGARELYLVVTDGGDGFAADWADWIEPRLLKADGSALKLKELKPKVSKAGWGKVHIDKNANGEPMRVSGKPVTGIGTHAPSVIAFDLPADIVAFEGQAALDNGGTDQGGGSSVVFQLYTQAPPAKVLAMSSGQGGGDSGQKGIDQRYGKAAENMSTFKTPEGLQATLFAAEPMIQNPTNIDIDHRGRVWAIEAVNYRSTFKQWGILRPEGDRVVILEDSDGDGSADKETTFWQTPQLLAPLGICVLPQPAGANGRGTTQVIVSAAPNIWLLTDADGDDKAEKAEKIFTVGGNWDHDHEVHAFVFGPDGKFYFNFGNEGQVLKDANGKVIVDMAGNEVTAKGKPYRQGMVFRCDLIDGKPANIETLGWNFRNNYEVCVDAFGTMWQSDNDDDGNKGVRINYVMEFGNYGYTDEITGAGWSSKRTNMEAEIPLRHWHQNDPGSVPNLLQTGAGSPTGILINEGAALGPQFTNQLIHCDAGPRTVRAYPVQKSGAGYTATMVDILTSSDSWYRPADVSIAPDGSLVVADWYDPGVGGHNMGDHEKGKIMGRIYRVAAPGKKAQVPVADFKTPQGAARALQSPNTATQYAGWQALRGMGAEAEPALLELWKSPAPRVRARALGLLARIPGKQTEHLRAGLNDPDEDVRIAAVRLCTTLERSSLLDTSPLDEDRALVGKLLRDTPQVRRQIALSLSGAKDIAELWAALAMQHDGRDRWYLEALGIGSRGNEDACFDAWLAAIGDGWDTPAGRDIIWRMRSQKAPEFLARLITGDSVPDAEKLRFARSFDFLPESPRKTAALAKLASLGSRNETIAGEALQRLTKVDLNADPALKETVTGILAAARGTPRFVELVRDFKLKDQGPGLFEVIAKDPTTPAAIEAAKLLLTPDYTPLVEREIKADDALKLVIAFGNTADQRAARILLPIATDLNRDLGIRKQAVKSLIQSQAGTQSVLKLAAENKFPEDLKMTATGAFAAVQMPKFKDEIARLFPLPSAAGGQQLPPIAELAKMKGDIARGKAVYARAESTCVTCHRAAGVGADVGPALDEIGSKLAREALYESIIAPNAGLSMGFETTHLTLKNGDAAMGIVRSDTAEELVLAMPGGIQNRYRKSDIAKREKLPVSLMPHGLQAMMSTQELVDLVEYLASLKKP